MRALVLILTLLVGVPAMAKPVGNVETDRPGRELDALEAFERSEEGQELNSIMRMIDKGEDGDKVDRAIQEHRKRWGHPTSNRAPAPAKKGK